MMHDMTTGKPIVKFRGPKREPYNITRENSGYFEPCRQKGYTCPKGTPETEADHLLNDRNYRTFIMYRQARGTGFKFMPEPDALLADNFGIIDTMMREYDRVQQADTTLAGIGHIMDALKRPQT